VTPAHEREATDHIGVRFLLPGERRLALWGASRVRETQGNPKQLLAGVYTVLAALWGTAGAAIGVVGVALDVLGHGRPAAAFIAAAFVLLGVSGVRQLQSRAALRSGSP